MTGTQTMVASQAGPSTFHDSEDFIAFDDGDEGGEDGADESGGEREAAQMDDKTAASNGHKANGASSTRASGKKRKVDDVVEVGGKSKREKKRELARGTPWCVDVDFDGCVTATDVLHDELMAFADWISPTPREHETRKMVIELIRRAIEGQWRDAEVHAFGSQNTQLYMPQGDIDLVVVSRSMDSQKRPNVLRSLANLLRKNNLGTDIKVIAHAKVPIVKFVCPYGMYKVDISINQTNGLDASIFVQDWLIKMPALRPLIMATKLLLSQRGMSEVFSGGLGSYSVICLVISHLQMHPKIQRGEIDPSRNLGVLFLEFLELFGKNFGYDEVGISIVGRGKYFRKMGRGWRDSARPFLLSIEDPGDPSNDISKGSYSILNVRQTFGGAFDIMTAVMCQRTREATEKKRRDRNGKHKRFDEDEEAREALVSSARLGESDKDPESLLGHIVGVNREMLKARKNTNRLFEGGSLQHMLGRPPAGRDPMPYEAHRTSERGERRSKAAHAVKERGKENGDGDGAGKRAHTSKGAGKARMGTANDPIVVVDDSSHQEDGATKSERRLQASALRLGPEESPLREREEEEEEEEEEERDTRYEASTQRSQKRASRLDHFAKVAPKTFVIDDSASDDDDEEVESAEEGEVLDERRPKKKTKSGGKRSQEERRAYWENKGNAVGGWEDDDDEGLHVYQ